MSRRARKLPLVALSIAVALSVALAATVAQARSYRASLSIEYDQKHARFEGHLDTAPICEARRTVSVYQVRPGNDRLIGREKTDRHGDFEVANAAGRTGNFYARVLVTVRGDERQHLCKGDRSDTIRVRD